MRVLMVGPARSMKGGVASVTNGYIEGGLGNVCDLDYIGTVCDGNAIAKAATFIRACNAFRLGVKQADIVHVHVSMRGSFERKAKLVNIAKRYGKIVVVHEHDGEFAKLYESGSKEYRSRVRRFFDRADKVIVLSEEWRDYFSDNICPQSKIIIMRNAVRVPQSSASLIEKSDVLFLGRMGSLKSPDVLLRAAKNVLEVHPEMRFRFGGNGDKEHYQKIARDLGIERSCDFVGWVKGAEKEKLFLDSGIFCLPSRNEGMPMGMLEAMSYGLPCIMTPVGGIPTVIQDGKNGFLCPVGDADALSRAVCILAADPDLRCRIGHAARKTIERDYAIERRILQLKELYESLIRR